MRITRRSLLAGAGSAACAQRTLAQETSAIRIGLLTDLSGSTRDTSGPTSVACVRQAILEMQAAAPGLAVELLTADHQQKPDVGASIVREWFDRASVDAVVGVNNSAIALAVNRVVEDKDKVHLNTGAVSADLTGPACSRNLVHWTYDTWEMAHSTGGAMVRAGGDTWFFITADYAFGRALQRDTSQFVMSAGGKVLGAVLYPFPGTADFSSYLLQAQASGAKVIGLANSSTDFVNTVKQAHEFGLTANGTRLAGLTVFITDVRALGLDAAQGLVLTETFYWDLNDRTRAFTSRVLPKTAGQYPNQEQAGDYAATLHYLKTVAAMGPARAKRSGRETVAAMKAIPTDDDCFGPGSIREDGRALHPAYLFQVKAPGESKGPWDCYKLVATTPANDAFRPLAQGQCPFIRT
ncbi:MAG: ABC transporter substrate-binding protein [Acetobacteraceae bacterium]|nr:ABC transporter substrate-binding protein [Acetobacteraceae bacterium]